MIIVGITGGLGSGKTLVSKIFSELGVKVVDADKVAKSLYSIEPKLKKEIIEAFGVDVLDEWGEISFKALADVAFVDDKSVETLNKIAHPYVRNAIRDKIIDHSVTSDIIAVDAALLFEGQLLYTVDYIITVTATLENRIQRVVASGRLTEEEARKRISFQFPDEEKIEKSDFVINNEGSTDDLKGEVEKILAEIRD